VPAKGSIPFLALLGDGSPAARAAFERNARLELKNPNTSPELRAELQRYLDNPIAAATADMQQLLDKRAPLVGGRATGEDRDEERERREIIRKLGDAHKDLSSPKLYNHEGAAAIRKVMKPKRFATILSEESPRRKRRVHRK
jgi:hypothetical protein